MKNYWSIAQNQTYFNYQFVLEHNKYDIELIKEILELVVLSGRKYGIIKVLDKVSGLSYCKEFLSLYKSILDNRKNVDSFKHFYDFFAPAFPNINEAHINPFVIVTKLAYYNKNGKIEIKDVFRNDIFYPLLNPYRVHLYHYSESSNYSPLSLELTISDNRELNLNVSTGLGIWFPYFKPDYDMDKQRLEDFPLNENGYIDNRELYLLNTPRLIGFIKELRTFFKKNKGKEITNSSKLEKMPIFPWYDI